MRNLFDHTIGPQDKLPMVKNRKQHYIVIDSNLRNKTLYTSPSKYTVTLDETYKYITSVELVSSCVPTLDLINITTGSNDTITINGGSGNVSATVDSGEYTGEELADELETKINASALSNFTVDYDEEKSKFIFGNTAAAFSVKNTGNISNTVGIKRTLDSSSSAPFTSTLPYKVEKLNCPYVMLRIGELEHMNATTGNNSAIRDAFGMISIKRSFIEETIIHENTNIKHFNPVLPRLAKLNIEFVRPDNTLHDFRGKEHVLVFKITTMNGNGAF